jgi:hypothetical protein
MKDWYHFKDWNRILEFKDCPPQDATAFYPYNSLVFPPGTALSIR